MFLPPLILFPFVLAMAVYRLYRLPRMVWTGERQLQRGRFCSVLTLTAAAYIGLLAYTVTLCIVVVRTVMQARFSMAVLLPVASLLAAYPVAYVAAEWVFYYGFRKPKPRSPD